LIKKIEEKKIKLKIFEKKMKKYQIVASKILTNLERMHLTTSKINGYIQK
jgi:hypothetical protein